MRGLPEKCSMVWYGMVWYGMVWYGMVWYGERTTAKECEEER
jgi:hypothetical protein